MTDEIIRSVQETTTKLGGETVTQATYSVHRRIIGELKKKMTPTAFFLFGEFVPYLQTLMGGLA